MGEVVGGVMEAFKLLHRQRAPEVQGLEIVTPDKFKKLSISEMPKVMNGPKCFECFQWVVFFTCEICERHFHRECAFAKGRQPWPKFDQPLEVAQKAEYGTVKMVECWYCQVDENTRFPTLKGIPQDKLNLALGLIHRHFAKDRGEIWSKNPGKESGQWFFDISLEMIEEKIAGALYKTLEGLCGDYRRIFYNIIAKYTLDDEEGFAVRILNNELEKDVELLSFASCWECFLNKWNEKGKLRTAKEYGPVNVKTCRIPHPLVWVKEKNWPYWPGKLMSYVRSRGVFTIHCFGDGAAKGVRFIKFPCQEGEGYGLKVYSTQLVSKKPTKGRMATMFENGMKECNQYIENLEAWFGKEGVVIPKKAVPFDGNLGKLKKDMFPLYRPGE